MPGPKPTAVNVDALVERQQAVESAIRSLMGHVADTESSSPPSLSLVGLPPLTAPVAAKRKKGQVVSLTELPPVPDKADTHWDYLLKEMQWLATDFMAERKRHQSSRRRLSNGVRQHFKSQESRAQTALQQAETKRRKVAGKLTRDVKAWWNKLEKIITYRQKVLYDKSRQQAMNRQLVTLVQQTERYTESLANSSNNVNNNNNNNNGPPMGRLRQRRSSPRRCLTIEEALAQTTRTRKVHDYARLAQQQQQQQQTSGDGGDDDNSSNSNNEEEDSITMYGVAWDSASDQASDSSYSPESAESDDETTLKEAEVAEQEERGKKTDSTFCADPVELLKLMQERDMDIADVFKRLREEGQDKSKPDVPMPDVKTHDNTLGEESIEKVDDEKGYQKRVQFAKNTNVHPMDPGADAPDDGDASDLEEFVDADKEPDEEFQPDGPAIDDETTMEQEEALPQEMTPEEELKLLNDEMEIPVEELRKRFAGAFAPDEGEADGDETETSNIDDEEDAAGADDEDFEPEKGTDADDETTIEAEEKLGRDMSYADEIALLKRENELSVEELKAMYSNVEGSVDNEDTDAMDVDETEGRLEQEVSAASLLEKSPEDESDLDEYQPEKGADVDDETTIQAEESLGREMSYDDEIAMLEREGEMSIEELKAMYAGMGNQSDTNDGSKGEAHEEETQKPSGDNDSEKGLAGQGEDESMHEDESTAVVRKRQKRQSFQTDSTEVSQENESKRHRTNEPTDIEDTEAALAALEASAEKARTTLASRPFLLSNWVVLREYQQIGLNWLVSLHTRRLNGILADEMGLGKTLQTISLLAYLASYKGVWGPHLVVVPTSVILNWETELKRFCPSFKVLCYYGSAKRRKELRTGWTKTNVYHVVITSYQLAVQDAFAFKRKRWYYLVLDEAQNIKNFQSQRWQTLINFNTQRRLLLSGTPLQNTLMELWSLLHFLMPYIFRSRKEFSYWFANPMSSMIEGNTEHNSDVIQRLHGILRPFILRRLKKDVETQMPGKFEHIVKCQLSRRQMYLYEEFMSRSSTRQALKSGSGNFMAMMNVLMQLRKVCNHPDLFEPRSIITPFVLDPVPYTLPHFVFFQHELVDKLSVGLLTPLWCGSTGQPDFDVAMSHGIVQSDGLATLCEDVLAFNTMSESEEVESGFGHEEDGLVNLIRRIRMTREAARQQTIRFQNHLNRRRCHAKCFAFSNLLQSMVKTPGEFRTRADMTVLNTPSALLAMRRTQQQCADDVDHLVKKFVFCVPKAGVREQTSRSWALHSESQDALLRPLEECVRPFRAVEARLNSFFPDKKLVQFDAGKLQTLAELLRELKRGGHKTLIFTQMSKMLDILEAFLNLNGHTYLRLDGSTGVDRRQRLMDRFNNDKKIFCFILSTRSGGLGINLTGADTVVFYDTDWNPAMDAQAQDRAHRIGQTREVHVYRLVTEQTIEENILMKAKQKRNLDILVMDQGKFDSLHLFRSADEARMSAPDTNSKHVFTKSGLQSILGVSEEADGGEKVVDVNRSDAEKKMTAEQMESAMTELEDKDDVQALRGARQEAAEELKEFDESIEIKKEEDGEEDEEPKPQEDRGKDEKSEREALEKEFAAWQTEVGMDDEAIEASLSSVERYGLRLREEIDPFYSLYAVLEYNRKMDEEEEADNELDIDEIEADKAEDERRAIRDGDLLVTDPLPEELVRQRNLFRRERARVKANMKRRQMTGENWEVRVDQQCSQSYWYNVDTGEATWDKPSVLVELESLEKAREVGWAMIPPLVKIMSFLVPFPDRMKAALVCHQWRKAAFDPKFVRHVYPVEMGASTRSKMHHNHYRSLADAVAIAHPGDSIEFSDGHYWVNEDLVIEQPLRLVGDEFHPMNVIVEMNNGSCLEWKAKGGWIEGITFRRPQIASSKIVSKPIFCLSSQSSLTMYESTIDNEGSDHAVALETFEEARLRLNGVSVRGGNVNVAETSVVDRS